MGLITGNTIWGGLGGLGNAVSQQATADLAQQRQMDTYKQMSDLDQAKQQALMSYGQGLAKDTAKYQQGLQLDSLQQQNDPNSPVGSAILAMDAARRQAEIDATLRNAPALGAAAGAQAAAQATTEAGTPGFLTAQRQIKDATASVSERAQAGLAGAETSQVKQAVAVKQELLDAQKSGDPDRIAKAQEAFSLINGGGRSMKDVVSQEGILQSEIKSELARVDPMNQEFMNLKPDEQQQRKVAAQARVQQLQTQLDSLAASVAGRRAGVATPAPGASAPGAGFDYARFHTGTGGGAGGSGSPSPVAPPPPSPSPAGPAVDPLADTKRYLLSKVIAGAVDKAGALREIAIGNGNPKFREAATSLLQDMQGSDTAVQGAQNGAM